MNNKRGFTLIELSIVLVIIGLIAGGVLMGQDLIHQSKLRTAISDFDEIKKAINMYKFRYNAIPGDDPKAAQHFPGQTSGNGDGVVISSGSNEYYRFFDHLEAADILDVERNPDFVRYMKSSAYEDGGMIVYTATTHSLWGQALIIDWVRLMPGFTPSAHQTAGGVITPRDGKSIDEKIDDGVGSTGQFIGLRGRGTGFTWECATVYTASGVINGDWRATYDAQRACRVNIKAD